MATERIIIVIEERGTRRVKREIVEVGQSAERSAGSLGLLRKSLIAVGSVQTLRLALGTLADFEQQLSTVRGITGATESQFAALRDTAADLGTTTRFAASEAAQGMVLLARAGFTVDEQLASIDDTLLLAQAGALDLASAADIASNVLRGFRLEASEASRAVDVLALAANSSNTNVLQLGDALKFVAPIASGLGVSLEETTASIGALSDAGLQASLAGTGLRRVLSELESPAGKTRGILASLGLSADDVRISQVGLTEALTRLRDAGLDTGQALEVFGDRGGPAFEVLSQAIPRVEEMTGKLRDSAGTAKELAEIMDDNLNGAILAAKSALEGFVLALGAAGITDAAESGFRGLAASLRLLADNAENLVDVLGPLGAAFLALKLAPLVQQTALATSAFINLRRQVAAGTVVVLGSAEAERQKALFTVQGIQADIAKTQSTLAAARAETARALAVTGSTNAMFIQAAAQKQIALIEAQLTSQTLALTAAQANLGVATKAAAIQGNLFTATLAKARAGVASLTAVIAANPIGAIFVGLSTVIALLIAFDDRIKVSSDGAATLQDVFVETFHAIGDVLSSVGFLIKDTFEELDGFLEPIVGEVDFSIKGILLATARFADNFVGFYEGAIFAAIEIFRGLGPAVQDLAISGINGLLRFIERGIRSQQALALAVVNSIGVTAGQVALGLDNLAQAARQSLAGNVESAAEFAKSGASLITNAAQVGFRNFSNNAQEEFDRLDAEQLFGRLRNPSEGAASELGRNVGDAFLEGFNRTNLEDTVTAILDRAEQRAQRRRGDQSVAGDGAAGGVAPSGIDIAIESFNQFLAAVSQRSGVFADLNADLEAQAALLRLNNREQGIANDLADIEASLAEKNITLGASERDLLEERVRNLQSLREQADLLEEIRGPQEQLAVRQEALTELFRSGRISAEEYAEGLRSIERAAAQTDRTLSGGFERGLLRVEETIFNFSDQAESTIVNAFGNAENALIDFRKTGEFEFHALTESILDDLQRLLQRQALFALINAFGGDPAAGAGGAGGLAGLLGGRQIGGPVNSGQPVITGENGRELFVPSGPGNIVPAGPTSQILSGQQRVSVTVVNLVDPRDIVEAGLEGAEGDEIVLNKIGKNRRRVNADLGNGG